MSEDTLCCCEFEDENGERSHILACCCNCEALDQAFDSCISCRGIPDEIVWRFMKTLEDRCRVPGLTGKGAARLPLDIIAPVIAIPLSLTVATLGPVTSCLVLLLMPVSMLYCYGVLRRNSARSRTRFFYAWGVVSVLVMLMCFEYLIAPQRGMIFWENFLLLTGSLGMFYYLWKAKSRPSFIEKAQLYSESTREISEGSVKVNMNAENGQLASSVEELTAPTILESEVTWLDSRPVVDGRLSTWCQYCQVKKPPRSGHCNICNSCISVRDHHCVWIDTCVGSRNHRPFLSAMILFILCGYYGSHVTLTTICIYDRTESWLPYHCNLNRIYKDYRTAFCFVSVCYTILCTTVMFAGLFQQTVFISQNVTSQEFHVATKRRWLKWWCVARHNLHNQGVLKNWISFLNTERLNPGKVSV